MKKIYFGLVLLLAVSAHGFSDPDQNCPVAWLNGVNSDLPQCPSGRLISESYPVAAVVVSESEDSKIPFTVDFVLKTLQGAGAKTPLIMMIVSNGTMQKVRASIQTLDISQQEKDRYLQALVQIKGQPRTNWQQDYFQAFVDSSDGKPELRNLEDYWESASSLSDPGESFARIAQITQGCGFHIGAEMHRGSKPPTGTDGGNFQALPFGVCAIGNGPFEMHSDWDSVVTSFCGSDPNRRVEVPTAWLQTGHTDEVLKTLRNHNQKAPCDFSIAIASPRKAIELLNQAPKEPFTDAKTPERTLWSLCKFAKPQSHPVDSGNPQPVNGTSKLETLFSAAWAAENCPFGLTNADVLTVLATSKQFKIFNDLVQNKMDNLTREIKTKLHQLHPECKLDIIEVPDLFYGNAPTQPQPKWDLPKRTGYSILPNPTNAASVNDTLISPEPKNAVFKRYLEEQYNKRGLKSEFIDTFLYSHQKAGNVHCLTHTIHICKPIQSRLGKLNHD